MGVAACVVAAVGWLYLLHRAGLLALGPRVPGSLPLEQLAGEDAQPLLRLVVVWLPPGALAGALLRRWGGLGPLAALGAIATVAALLLVTSGAVSDAAAISDSVQSHLWAQFSRAGTWVALALMLAGALPVVRARR